MNLKLVGLVELDTPYSLALQKLRDQRAVIAQTPQMRLI
jgi:hypothetical protein